LIGPNFKSLTKLKKKIGKKEEKSKEKLRKNSPKRKENDFKSNFEEKNEKIFVKNEKIEEKLEENEKKDEKKFKIEENLEEIKPKRSEPLPEIKNFAANLLKFSFEPEKFTCFFLQPLPKLAFDDRCMGTSHGDPKTQKESSSLARMRRNCIADPCNLRLEKFRNKIGKKIGKPIKYQKKNTKKFRRNEKKTN